MSNQKLILVKQKSKVYVFSPKYMLKLQNNRQTRLFWPANYRYINCTHWFHALAGVEMFKNLSRTFVLFVQKL